MKKKWMYGLVPVACLVLVACGKKEPTGQVVATVDGDEITLTELRDEMSGMNVPTPQARKAAEQAALRVIINRKIIAKAAEEQKLDKTPQFAMQEERMIETLKASTLQKRVVDSVGEPSRDEVSKFIAQNPDLFAQRKIFVVEQIRLPIPSDPAIMKDFEPLKTLEEVEALLNTKGMKYQRGMNNIDALGNDPRLVSAITKLPPNEVFVVPSGQFVLINRVKETRVVPFVGEQATAYATNVVKQRQVQEAVDKQLGAIVKQAETTVKYNKQFEPPKAPAGKVAQTTPKA